MMFGQAPVGLPQPQPLPNAPTPQFPSPDIQAPPKRGMFGGAQIDLGRAIAGYLAGIGNPAGVQALQAMNERRREQERLAQEQDQYQRERADKQTDWRSQYDYELGHPKPANNDTANDYSFWQQHLSPDQFQEYVSNKINPPQYMNVPGVGLVQIPRGGGPAVPTAPVGKLTPLGAGGPAPGPGGFHY